MASKKPRATVRVVRRTPPTPAGREATYHPSPEHKTHSGPWGAPQWHPRDPELSACPTDIAMSDAQGWLERALSTPACWEEGDTPPEWKGRRWPGYLHWFVEGRGFFTAQREQRKPATAGPFTYKAYPAEAAQVPRTVVQAMHEQKLLSVEQFIQWRRSAKLKAGRES